MQEGPPISLGELPHRLAELQQCMAEITMAATPWMLGELLAPRAQLEDLGTKLRTLQTATAAALSEARAVHTTAVERSREAQALLGRWDNAA